MSDDKQLLESIRRDMRYKEGQLLESIQPEAGMNGFAVGNAAWRDGPIVGAIMVVMEDGLYCGIPHFAILDESGVLIRKYNAMVCFGSGRVLPPPPNAELRNSDE